MIKRLKQVFVNIYESPMSEQRELLDHELVDWIEKGNTEQVDDVLVIGYRVQVMFQFSLSEIAAITSSECEGNGNIKITKIQTDSRTSFDEISAIFLALKGVSRNGHDYIADMHERGCRNFWVEKG